jgi:hypothetical protein
MHSHSILRASAVIVLLGVFLVSCAGQPTSVATTSPPLATDVPVAAKTVWAGTYGKDIQPVLDQYCVKCHGVAVAENGLRLDSYDGVMKGTTSGKVVIPGSPATSTLMTVIQGTADPKIQMPHNSGKLSPNRIENIRLWIQAGAQNG